MTRLRRLIAVMLLVGLLVALLPGCAADTTVEPAAVTPAAATPVATRPAATAPARAPTSAPTDVPAQPAAPSAGPTACVAPRAHGALKLTNGDSYALDILTFLNAGATAAELHQALLKAQLLLPEDGETDEVPPVFAADLTNDNRDDLLVTIRTNRPEEVAPGRDLLLYVCQGARYELKHLLAHRSLSFAIPGAGLVLHALQDLNADGQPELAVGQVTCGVNTCYEQVHILQWDGQAFAERLNGDTVDGLPYSEVAITDDDWDGVYQLVAIGSLYGSAGAGAQRTRTRLFTYSRESLTWNLESESLGPSDYRIHALHDGDAALKRGDYATAIKLYEQVIKDDSLDDFSMGEYTPAESRAGLAAFASYRLVTVHALQDQATQAGTVLTKMRGAYPKNSTGYPYVGLADSFMTSFRILRNIDEVCRSVEAYVAEHNELMRPLNSFGWANPDYVPSDFCVPVVRTAQPTATPAVQKPKPTATVAGLPAGKYEFTAYETVACGGISPLPGCVYTLEKWVGPTGPIAPGKEIKVLVMNPKSVGAPDVDSCKGESVDEKAYQNSFAPIRVRVRGEPCDWRPDYLFCVCGAGDSVRMEQ